MGPEKAVDALRKALAMGADRAVLVSDDGAAGSDLVATSRVLAAALERESADLVLFGQYAADSEGAVLWAAVAERLRRPLLSQVAELTVEGGSLTGRRQTEFGYDVIRAPLPAVVAVADSINEPRYPSLKGIMGAKKKPQDVLSLADLGVEAGEGASRTTVLAPGRPAAARRLAEGRGRRQRGRADRRLPRREEARLVAGTLVFLEHHGDELLKPSLAVLSKAAQLGGDGLGGRRRLGRRAAGGRGRGSSAPPPSSSRTTRGSRRRSRSRVSTCSRSSSASTSSTPSSSPRRSSARTWPPRSPRASTRGSTGSSPTSSSRTGSSSASSRRSRTAVICDVGWTSTPRLALFRAGAFDPVETGGEARVERVEPRLEDFSTQAEMLEQAHEEQSGPSIEDADVIVAGGRGLGSPEAFSLAEELAKALGGAVAATRAVVDAGWYPYAAQVGQTGKTVSPKLYVALGISGAIQHKVGMQSSQVIVAINKDPNAPIFEYSDLGVVGDVHQIVPKLTELVRERRS